MAATLALEGSIGLLIPTDCIPLHETQAFAVLGSCQSTSLVSATESQCLQDPDVLELFNPYLPRNARTHAGLAKAMTIADWRRQVLVGESQVL